MRTAFRLPYLRGATLPATLLLLTAATLSALAALRSTASETQLTGTLLASHRAFVLAERGIATGYRVALADPAGLPTATARVLPPLEIEGVGRVDIVIQPGAADNNCPALAPLPAERQHYEIHARALTAAAIRTTHVQGFYVCREVCVTTGCIAAELAPIRSHWHARMGAAS